MDAIKWFFSATLWFWVVLLLRIIGAPLGQSVAESLAESFPRLAADPYLLQDGALYGELLFPSVAMIFARMSMRRGVPVDTILTAFWWVCASDIADVGYFLIANAPYASAHGWHPVIEDMKADIVAAFVALMVTVVVMVIAISGKGKFQVDRNKDAKKKVDKSGPWKQAFMPEDVAVKKFSNPEGALALAEIYNPDEHPERAGKAPILWWKPYGSLCTIAPPRTGKGRGLVVLNCGLYSGPMFVIDPAMETLPIVRRAREAMGRKIIYFSESPDTFGIDAYEGLDPTNERCPELVDETASWLDTAEKPQGKGEMFARNAQSVIKFGIMIGITDPKYIGKGLYGLREIITRPDFTDFVKRQVSNPACFGAIADTASALCSFIDTKETFDGVMANVMSSTDFLRHPQKARWLSGQNLKPGKLASVNDLIMGKADMFLCVSAETLEANTGIGRCIVGCISRAITLYNNKLPQTLVMMLDECPTTLGNLSTIPKLINVQGKYNVRVWIFAQGRAQLDGVWQEHGRKTLLNGCAMQQVMAVRELELAEDWSKIVGDTTREQKSDSQSLGNSHTSGQVANNRSVNQAVNVQGVKDAVISASEIMSNMAVTEEGNAASCLIKIGGFQTVYAGLAFYDRRKDLEGVFDENRYAPTTATQDKNEEFVVDPVTNCRIILNNSYEKTVHGRFVLRVNRLLRSMGFKIHEWD